MAPRDRHIEGVVQMTLDAAQHYDRPLTAQRLYGWHAWLFPDGRSGLRRIHAGAWRDDSAGPMQVVSGPIGRERVHFEAPSAGRLDAEMHAFLGWFNASQPGRDLVLKAALAHLWFVTLHPFEDGNGRIARAITDLALARSEQSPQRFYSMSAQIGDERAEYYRALEETQQGGMDLTGWMEWFLSCLGQAMANAGRLHGRVLEKARFWQAHQDVPLTERQRLILSRLLDGFQGKLTTSKWAAMAKCSSDTALRDVTALVGQGLLMRNPGSGRSTSYALVGVIAPASRG